MQNNESKESLNDDFWKILSDSDEDESEIDALLRSRERGVEKSSGKKEDIRRLFAEESSGSDAENVESGVSEEWSTATLGNTTNSRIGASTEESRAPASEKPASDLEGQSSESATPDGSRAVRKPMDEMDFLWDDDEEDFIVGKIGQMHIREECASQKPGDSPAEGSSPPPETVPEDASPESVCSELSSSSNHEDVQLPEPVDEPAAPAEAVPAKCAPVEAKFNPLRPRPVSRFVCGSLLCTFMTSQRRFNKQGEAVQSSVNVSQWFRVEVRLPAIKPSAFASQAGSEADARYSQVHRLVQLKDPHVESILEIVPAAQPVYCREDVSFSMGQRQINAFVELCFKSEDRAFEYAMENEMWTFAMLLPRRGREAASMFLQTFCAAEYTPLLSALLDLPSSSLRLGGDWRMCLGQVLNAGNAALAHDFILQVHAKSCPDALFAALACHLLKIVDVGRYLPLFSRNFEALRILSYVEHVTKSVKNLDLLKYEFVLAAVEFDRMKAEEYFGANRKSFRRELSDSLCALLDTKRSFGLKSVFDFGLKKILNVEDLDEKDRVSVKRDEVVVETVPAIEEVKEARPAGGSEAPESVYIPPSSEVDGAESKGGLYLGNQQSKSFADFFNSRPEEAVRSEDDTSLFLSRFAEDDAPKKEEPQKKNGSFFGFLNMFKKEPVHKVKIDADDDFRYDPVSKKWISSSASGSSVGEGAAMQPQRVPRPVAGNVPARVLDVDEGSMYANRKSAGNKSIPGSLSKKN